MKQQSKSIFPNRAVFKVKAYLMLMWILGSIGAVAIYFTIREPSCSSADIIGGTIAFWALIGMMIQFTISAWVRIKGVK